MDYKVRFVDYPLHYKNIESEIDAAIKEVLSRGDFIMRQQLEDFENNIAAFIGVDYAVGLNSGTDALYLSLLASGIGPGDEVITVAHTFLATVGAIVNCGATPILVDVAEDFNMNVEQAEGAISSRTKAIIPVYLNGRLCDMERVMAIADKHNLLVIEDAAQALGASFDSRKAGSFGLTGCFSFYPAKILGTPGDGGLISTNDEAIANRIRALRDNGRVMGQDEVVCYGFNSRLDNLHAAILNVKLKYLPRWIIRRREIAAIYEQGLSDLPQIKLPLAPGVDSKFYDAYQNYVIRSTERDRLVSYLRENGVEILISWLIPMHHQKALNLGHFALPETERISKEVISLPMYPELSNEKAEYVIKSIHQFHLTR